MCFISLPLTRVDHDREPAIVSCAGYYDDDESILRWTCHTREVRDAVFCRRSLQTCDAYMVTDNMINSTGSTRAPSSKFGVGGGG